MKKQTREHTPRPQKKKSHLVLWIILSLLLIGLTEKLLSEIN